MPLSFPSNFFRTDILLDAAEIEPGQTVVDLYPGHHGPCTFEVARRVGASGRVIAVDARRSAMDSLLGRKTLGPYGHVEVMHGHPEYLNGIELPDDFADGIVLVHALSLVRERLALVREAVRLLKSGGFIAIADWHPFGGAYGASVSRVSSLEAKSICIMSGAHPGKMIPVGDAHWAFVAIK